jgi:NTP pyrophosphatase (non-canonical NTP hydrolase)
MLADEYQRLAMEFANHTANDTDERRMLNTALGLVGESGEIAGYIGTGTPLVNDVLGLGFCTGLLADHLKKVIFHGHAYDDGEMHGTIAQMRHILSGIEIHMWQRNLESVVCERLSSDARDEVVKELGDIAWYTALGAESVHTPLSAVFQGNIDKLRRRYPEGFSSEASKNRSET